MWKTIKYSKVQLEAASYGCRALNKVKKLDAADRSHKINYALVSSGSGGWPSVSKVKSVGTYFHAELSIPASRMRTYKNAGIRVFLWTGKTKADYTKMAKLNPYGVVVNDVAKFQAWREHADITRRQPSLPAVMESLDRDSVGALHCAALVFSKANVGESHPRSLQYLATALSEHGSSRRIVSRAADLRRAMYQGLDPRPFMSSAAWPPVPVLMSVGRFDPLVAEREITCRTIARSLPGSPIANTQVSLAGLKPEVQRAEQRLRHLRGNNVNFVCPGGDDLVQILPVRDIGHDHFLVNPDVDRTGRSHVPERLGGLALLNGLQVVVESGDHRVSGRRGG